MSSLFAQYKTEREGKHVFETENSFLVYEYNDDSVYIEDIYVIPELRKSGEGRRLARMVEDIARQTGRKKVYGSVSPVANNATDSLKVLLSDGYRLSRVDNSIIYFEKDL